MRHILISIAIALSFVCAHARASADCKVQLSESGDTLMFQIQGKPFNVDLIGSNGELRTCIVFSHFVVLDVYLGGAGTSSTTEEERVFILELKDSTWTERDCRLTMSVLTRWDPKAKRTEVIRETHPLTIKEMPSGDLRLTDQKTEKITIIKKSP